MCYICSIFLLIMEKKKCISKSTLNSLIFLFNPFLKFCQLFILTNIKTLSPKTKWSCLFIYLFFLPSGEVYANNHKRLCQSLIKMFGSASRFQHSNIIKWLCDNILAFQRGMSTNDSGKNSTKPTQNIKRYVENI